MRHRTRRFGFLTCCAAVVLGCAGTSDGAAADTGAAATAVAAAGAASAPEADRRADEQAIRVLVAKAGTPDEAKPTDDAVFVSGAFARPVVGNVANAPTRPELKTDQRRNNKTEHRVERIEVAQAGDIAYEYSDFTSTFDRADTKEHHTIDGSVLRVWKKVGGEWRPAATFVRPNQQAK